MEKTFDVQTALAEADEMEGKYLTFWTDKQLFGVPIADVVQIVGLQEITEIPEFPSYARGIINLRGSIIPIIDVRRRFGKPETEYDEHSCIIVTSIEDKLIGFLVDGVEEVTDIPAEEIAAPPTVSGDSVNAYLTGLGKQEGRVILLIDPKKILNLDQLGLLDSGAF